MIISIIFAGGTGQRMKSNSIPKQFLKLNDKPILAYTVELFENHPEIDGIVLVCLESWIDECKKICMEYGFSKVKFVVPGGNTAQESIYNGLKCANENYSSDSIVLIHDGVRPLITADTISDAISCAKKNGNAIPVTLANDTIAINSADGKLGTIMERKNCLHAKAPQTYILSEIYDIHEKARAEGKLDFIDCASMMQYYGKELYTFECSTDNIKITTPVDFYVFDAILKSREDIYHIENE